MTTLAVKLTWDRCGRRRPDNPRSDGFEEVITIPDKADVGPDLAEAIYRISRRWIMSSDYAVHVWDTGNGGTFSLEGDRFGGGRWEIVTTVNDREETTT